jgi:hypothetical protein
MVLQSQCELGIEARFWTDKPKVDDDQAHVLRIVRRRGKNSKGQPTRLALLSTPGCLTSLKCISSLRRLNSIECIGSFRRVPFHHSWPVRAGQDFSKRNLLK